MDLTDSIAPKSDQLNAEDLLTGPRTFTIEKVAAGSIEQPVNVHLVEFPGRPYRPSKSMRRLMVAAWGKESSVYAGRRLTLYRNPDIMFGKDKVGGIPPSAPTIPDDVKANTEKAVAEGTIDQYIAWLAEHNAPAHILDYVSERKPTT